MCGYWLPPRIHHLAIFISARFRHRLTLLIILDTDLYQSRLENALGVIASAAKQSGFLDCHGLNGRPRNDDPPFQKRIYLKQSVLH
jgi:hypothetical protein